jgi:hypothetical protein
VILNMEVSVAGLDGPPVLKAIANGEYDQYFIPFADQTVAGGETYTIYIIYIIHVQHALFCKLVSLRYHLIHDLRRRAFIQYADNV